MSDIKHIFGVYTKLDQKMHKFCYCNVRFVTACYTDMLLSCHPKRILSRASPCNYANILRNNFFYTYANCNSFIFKLKIIQTPALNKLTFYFQFHFSVKMFNWKTSSTNSTCTRTLIVIGKKKSLSLWWTKM